MADPKHLPYEEEAHVITDIMNFIFEKLPHSIEESIEHVDEARLASRLVEDLESKTDDELAALKIKRDDIAKIAGHAAGLFHIANQEKKSKAA